MPPIGDEAANRDTFTVRNDVGGVRYEVPKSKSGAKTEEMLKKNAVQLASRGIRAAFRLRLDKALLNAGLWTLTWCRSRTLSMRLCVLALP
jgi:hypothetical protein